GRPDHGQAPRLQRPGEARRREPHPGRGRGRARRSGLSRSACERKTGRMDTGAPARAPYACRSDLSPMTTRVLPDFERRVHDALTAEQPSLRPLEDLITDGCAAALHLETERARLDRRREALLDRMG